MRKVILAVLLLSLLATSLPLAVAQTRPRRVGQSAPDAVATPLPSTSAPTRSPQASTGSSPTTNRTTSQQPPVASTRSNQEPEEVGEDEVVRVNTTLVTVPVSVMDRNGKYVPDMRQADFHLYEEGVEQQIAYFTSTEKPFTVALLIDTSRSTTFRLEDIQEAAMAFVDQLRLDDRVMVVSFDEDIRVLSEPTNNRQALYQAIRRTRTGGGTRLYDAVDLVLNTRFSRIQGRKAIVLFTDGVDTTSKRSSYQSTVRDAEESEALIYPVQYDTYSDMRQVDPQGWPYPGGRGPIITIPGWPFPFPVPSRRRRPSLPWPWPFTNNMSNRSSSASSPLVLHAVAAQAGQSRDEYERASAYLRELAQRTGARLHQATSLRNLESSFALIAEELRRQYSLGYYPKSPPQAGQRRQIRVKVNQPNLVVRARDSYIFKPSANTAAAQNTERQTSKFDEQRSSGER